MESVLTFIALLAIAIMYIFGYNLFSNKIQPPRSIKYVIIVISGIFVYTVYYFLAPNIGEALYRHGYDRLLEERTLLNILIIFIGASIPYFIQKWVIDRFDGYMD